MEVNHLDPVLAHLSEEGKDRLVFDPPGSHHNLQCSSDGRIAMMSRHFIHIYSPKLQLVQVFNVSWIHLQPNVNVPVTASSENDENPLPFDELVRLAPINETRVVFKKIQWIPNIQRFDLDPMVLLCLLNDGSLLAFQQDFRVDEEKVEIQNITKDTIVMKNFVCIYDYGQDCGASTAAGDNLQHVKRSHRIETFEVIDTTKEDDCDGLFLITGSGTEIICWKIVVVETNESVNEKKKLQLTMMRTFSFGHSIDGSYILTIPPIISSLATMVLEDQSCCHIVCSFRHGSVVLLEGDWSTPNQFTISALDRAEFRYKVIDNIVVVGNIILLCCYNSVITLSVVNNKMQALWESQLHDYQITSLLAKQSKLLDSLILTSASLNGEIKYWKTKDQTLVLVESVTVEQGQHGIYGLAEDPIGCMTMYSYCSPRVLENTREVQLNYALGTEQTKFSFLPNRHLGKEWLMSPINVAAYLIHTVQELKTAKSKPVTYLGLMVLDSTEYMKRNFRKLPIKQLPPAIREVQIALENGEEIQKKKKSKSAPSSSNKMQKDVNDVDDEDSSEEEYLSDDNEGSPQKKGGKGKSGGGNEGGAGMTMLLERLRDYLDPDPLTLSSIALDLALEGFMLSTSCLAQCETLSTLEVLDRLAFAKDNSSSNTMKNAFLGLESDMALLEKKYYLWQMCHHTLCSIIAMRHSCLPQENVNRQKYMQMANELRPAILNARTVLACVRFLHYHQSFSPDIISSGATTMHKLLDLLPTHFPLAEGLKLSILSVLPKKASPHEDCCPICGVAITLNCDSQYRSQCATCQIEVDRCCLSLEVLSFGLISQRVSCCTLCKTAVNGNWALENARFSRIIYGSTYPICPFCGIFMQNLVT